MITHGYTLNTRNHGIHSRCICGTPAICHWFSVWYREQSKVAIGCEQQNLEIRSRFRALPNAGSTTMPAGKRQNLLRAVTLTCLQQQSGQPLRWLGEVLELRKPRISLTHYHPDFTIIYAAAKAVSEKAQFKLAWKTSPLPTSETLARLADGTATYLNGYFIALPTYKQKCAAKNVVHNQLVFLIQGSSTHCSKPSEIGGALMTLHHEVL